MKRFILTLSLFMLCFNLLKSEIKDTSKITSIQTISVKQQIIDKLFNAFAYQKFDSLIIFCNNDIDLFVVQNDTKANHRLVTDYGLISDLNAMFKGVNYETFKILSGITIKNNYVILVRIFFFEGYEIPDINVCFVLDNKESIKSVIIN